MFNFSRTNNYEISKLCNALYVAVTMTAISEIKEMPCRLYRKQIRCEYNVSANIKLAVEYHITLHVSKWFFVKRCSKLLSKPSVRNLLLDIQTQFC